MDFVNEPHSMQNCQEVSVIVRNNSDQSYEGMIYNIISLPFNRGRPNTDFVDYFYIQFPPNVYAKLLMRSSEIIYNNSQRVIGAIVTDSDRKTITRLTLQSTNMFSNDEIVVPPEKINAILIWRVAYDIKPINNE
jgi:hypothetical protein